MKLETSFSFCGWLLVLVLAFWYGYRIKWNNECPGLRYTKSLQFS